MWSQIKKIQKILNRALYFTTVPITYDIKDLFNQDDWEQIEERYSCAICCELIHKKEWYQCANGHIGCSNCWNRVLADNGSKQCPSCRTSVQSLTNGLSRCRFIEEEFARKKVSCPYQFNESIIKSDETIKLVRDDFNGCKEIIKIEQLDDHQLNCNSRFVKCNNDGCEYVTRFNQHQDTHQDICSQAIIKCKLCKEKFKRQLSSIHIELCPSAIISCSQCSIDLIRSLLPGHLKNECPNTIIQCKFKQYGCGAQLKRSELSNHMQQINHTEFMIKQIDEQLDQLKSEIKKLHQKEFLYGNTWIISNFIQRTKDTSCSSSINSPLIDTPHLKFILSAWNSYGVMQYYLYFKTLGIEKGEVKRSFKLLNCKDNSKDLVNDLGFLCDVADGFSRVSTYFNVEYSSESGYLFPDGSVHIEFTIYAERSSIQT